MIPVFLPTLDFYIDGELSCFRFCAESHMESVYELNQKCDVSLAWLSSDKRPTPKDDVIQFLMSEPNVNGEVRVKVFPHDGRAVGLAGASRREYPRPARPFIPSGAPGASWGRFTQDDA